MFQPFDPLNAEEASANLSNFLSPIRRQATASPGGAVHYDTMSLEKMAKVHRTAAGTFVRHYPFFSIYFLYFCVKLFECLFLHVTECCESLTYVTIILMEIYLFFSHL